MVAKVTPKVFCHFQPNTISILRCVLFFDLFRLKVLSLLLSLTLSSAQTNTHTLWPCVFMPLLLLTFSHVNSSTRLQSVKIFMFVFMLYTHKHTHTNRIEPQNLAHCEFSDNLLVKQRKHIINRGQCVRVRLRIHGG